MRCGDKICECNGITGPKQMLEALFPADRILVVGVCLPEKAISQYPPRGLESALMLMTSHIFGIKSCILDLLISYLVKCLWEDVEWCQLRAEASEFVPGRLWI